MTSESERPAGEKKTDESWKEKAQKEKEKLAGPSREGTGPPEGGPLEGALEDGQEFPPASFMGIVEELSLRAMLALGQLRHPATGEAYLDLEGAKYVIDLLSILEQKTKGNLEPIEERTLRDVLQNLRLAFVHISQNPPPVVEEGIEKPGKTGPGKQSSEKPAPKIIL
jgi:hypothetical protein